MILTKKKALFSVPFLLLIPMAVSKVFLAETNHFSIYAENSNITSKITQNDISFLKTYLEKVYNTLSEELGPYLKERCPKMTFVLTQPGGAYSAGCEFGMAYDALHNSFDGIYRYWAYVLPLHEMLNSFVWSVTNAWPSIHRRECNEGSGGSICYIEWWVDTIYGYPSPFPDTMDDYILKKMGYNKIAEIHYKTTRKTPFHYVFKEIINKYGVKPFKELFYYIKKYNINFDKMNFYETTYTIIYFLMVSTKKDLRELFITAGIPVPTDNEIAKLDKKYGLDVEGYLKVLPIKNVIWLNKGDWEPEEIIINGQYKFSKQTIKKITSMPIRGGKLEAYEIRGDIPSDIYSIEILHSGIGFSDPLWFISFSKTQPSPGIIGYKENFYIGKSHYFKGINGKNIEIIRSFVKVKIEDNGTIFSLRNSYKNEPNLTVLTEKQQTITQTAVGNENINDLQREVNELKGEIRYLKNKLAMVEERLNTLENRVNILERIVNKLIEIFAIFINNLVK